jgi:type IV pilus assembly protein PilN
MRIAINLATRPFADLGPALKRVRISMGILALVAIAFGVGLHAVHNKAEQARQRERTVDSQIERVTQERQSYQDLMNRPDNAQLLKQADALNRLFDEKAFSWTLTMQNLETVLPAGVQVSTLEPVRAKDGHITLHLRVVGPRDRSEDLVRNLEHSRRFFEPRIIGETSESNNLQNQRAEAVSASNRFTFDLLAEYNPPTLEEAKAAPIPVKAATEDRKSGHAAASSRSGAPPAGPPPAGASPAGAPPPTMPRRPLRPPYAGATTGGPR